MQGRRTLQYLAAFAAALSSMTASSSYSWTVPVIPKFHSNETDLSLTDAEISWVVSSAVPGQLLGCLISRFTSDRFGRRATLLGTAFTFVTGTIFVLSATNSWMLYIARFFWGVGAGAISPSVMIYIAEIASKDIRGRLSAMRHFMFTFGSLLVVTVGSFVSYKELSYMFIALSAFYFVACWCMPESPYFLIKEGKIDKAKKALKMLNGHLSEKDLEEMLASMRGQVRQEMRSSTTFMELITGPQYRKAALIAVGLRSTQLLTGSIPVQQYLGRILQHTGTDISISTGLIIFGSIRFSTSMAGSITVDKVGRRPLIIGSYTCAFFTLITLGTLFFFHEVLGKTPNHLGHITLGLLMFFTMVNNLGFDAVNFVIIAEIFPINVKATAVTSLNLFIGVLTFVALKGYQILKDFTGLYGVFWFFACFAISGAIFSYLIVPETKGKSLKEIQLQLQGPAYEEAQEKLREEIKQETETQETKFDKYEDSKQLKV